MEKELKKRIKELKEKLDDRYISPDVKNEIEEDIEFLLKLHHALYFY